MNDIQSYEKAVSAVSGAETPDFGTLRPTTSQWTERYDKKQLASPKQVLVTPGYSYCSEPEPQYLPPGWSPYTHPEGQLYFFRNAPLRIVTESYLYDPQTLTKALHWSKHIESILEDKQIPLSQHIELFIYIEDDGCSYYLVDHVAHTEFWLEELDTSELGLSDVDSDSHLRLALTELYWAHVEYFPMHLGGLPAKVVDDLICVLSHALTDQLTSRTSTYFWSADECRQLLDVAKIARDRSADGHQVCALARIWRTIFRNRVETHYGQEIARLSRDQPIIYDATKPTKVFEIANLFTFKTAGRYHAKLSDIFVDRLVYIAQWQPFITNAVRDWQRTSLEAFCCLLLHIFLIYFPQCTPLAVGSSALLVASILSSAILAHRYKPLQGITASEAFTHLDAVHSEKYGFQFVAMAYALPTTFHLWGLGLLSANALCVLAAYIALCPTIAFCIVAVALVISLARLTSETQMSMPSIRSFSFFSRRRRTEDEVV